MILNKMNTHRQHVLTFWRKHHPSKIDKNMEHDYDVTGRLAEWTVLIQLQIIFYPLFMGDIGP